MRRFGVIVLAAGGAERMGRPKQLAQLGGVTLVERAVLKALGCGAAEAVVVLGAEADQVIEVLQGQPVRLVVNKDWQGGIGGSIARGVSSLGPDVEAAIVTLADQPFVTSAHLQRLAKTSGGIVATEWDGGFGPPCLFERRHFSELASLTGDQGARELIQRHGAAYVGMEAARLDIDTPEDMATAERLESGMTGNDNS